jgi:hypothetical protein
MDLGFTDGAIVRPFLRTFAGDPRAYEVRGTLVALRRDQASQVLVRPMDRDGVRPMDRDGVSPEPAPRPARHPGGPSR